jgi:multiple antibiotic resistance protein
MFNIDQILTVSFTLFAVIDMPGAVPVLVSLKEKLGKIESGKATIASGVLMLLFLFIGEGLEMVLGLEFFKAEADSNSGSIVPVAFPLIAGSGTLTTIISLKSNFDSYNIIVGILINLVVIYLVLQSLRWWEKLLGKSGLMVVRKFFGVILLAIAVKIFKSSFGIL